MEIHTGLNLVYGLMGGLGLFLFGMRLMGTGLQKVAGDHLRKTLEVLSKNPVVSVLMGTLVTALVQSSTTTTLMLVSFVNAGLMSLKQAITVIMGANIGTTFTAQLISFDIWGWALPAIGLGFGLYFFSKKRTWRYLGQVVLGFGLLLLGMQVLSESLIPLAGASSVSQWMGLPARQPMIGLLLGVLITVAIRSSTATIGLLMALASQGLISFEASIPVLLGANIGTTITAMLASKGTSLGARRAALAHLLFNLLGSLIFILLLPVFLRLVHVATPRDGVLNLIANAHTAFNLINTLIWLPFTGFLAAVVVMILPGQERSLDWGSRYLDRRMLGTPSVALGLATKELIRMAHLAQEMIQEARQAFLQPEQRLFDQIQAKEDILDEAQVQVVDYLSTLLSKNVLTAPQSTRLAGLMHIVSDIERVGDHAHNMGEAAEVKWRERMEFTQEGMDELMSLFGLAEEAFRTAVDSLRSDDRAQAKRVMEIEKEIDGIKEQLRRSHIRRLNEGRCQPGTGIIYVETLANLERIGAHSTNIVEPVLDEELRIGRIEA